MNIIETINQEFGGDVNDKRPLHINSICRIAYAGYLRTVEKLRYKEVANEMNTSLGTTQDRLKKHKDFYSVDLYYRLMFDNVVKKLKDDNRN